MKKAILTLSATALFSLSAVANQQCTVRGILHTLDGAEMTIPCPDIYGEGELSRQEKSDFAKCLRDSADGDFEKGKARQTHLLKHNNYLNQFKVRILQEFKNNMFSDKEYACDTLLTALKDGLKIEGGDARIDSQNRLLIEVDGYTTPEYHSVVTGFPKDVLPK